MIKHIVGYTACRALGRSRPNGLLVSRHRLGPESISQGVAMRVAPGCRTAAGESVLHNTKGPLARAPWLVRHQYVTVDTKVDGCSSHAPGDRTWCEPVAPGFTPFTRILSGPGVTVYWFYYGHEHLFYMYKTLPATIIEHRSPEFRAGARRSRPQSSVRFVLHTLKGC